jgi:phenylpropionate dioxygenase-like ring-hydroxylating dioxygenase large terminal subunit
MDAAADLPHDLGGSAYDLPPPTYRRELTEVGRRTPMGELLRRYWHPVARSEDAGSTPRALRVLGEDLVLFRDGKGRAGLLHARCAHRGTTLYYGRVEAEGIRCCYHGWMFDVHGHCLEQPCEPGGGTHRDIARQPWYPTRERYGMVWAYMGPPAKMPVLPRFEPLENLEPGEFIETDDRSIGSGGAVIAECNWLQHWENVVDPFHVPVLHGWFSGVQFVKEMLILPDVEFAYTPLGVKVTSLRKLEDGRLFRRVTETAMPTLRVVPSPRLGRFERVESLGFVLPIDDTHYRIYTIGRVRAKGELQGFRSRLGGKLWEELTPDEHQRFPGDLEAQVGQGAITFHSEEHLTTTDQGIGMLRRFLHKQLDAMAAGKDPAGVIVDPSQDLVRFEAGNFPPQ